MKQQIDIEEVHAKITEEMGQNMIKSRKLFFPIFEICENKLPRKRPQR